MYIGLRLQEVIFLCVHNTATHAAILLIPEYVQYQQLETVSYVNKKKENI